MRHPIYREGVPWWARERRVEKGEGGVLRFDYGQCHPY